MADIYIVLDGSRVVGVSARLQGAELIRINEAKRIATSRIWLDMCQRWGFMNPEDQEKYLCGWMRIETWEVQDDGA